MSWNKVLVDNPRKPFALYRKKKRRYEITLTKQGAQIWGCGECGVLYTPWNSGDDPRKRAAECCKQEYCACGEKIERGYIGPKCSPCNSLEREQKRLAKATEIETFDGPVFSEDRERYWANLGEFEDWARDQIDDGDEDAVPEWLYPCDLKGFERLNAMDLIESYLVDQHHEDAADHIVDLEGLQAFLDAWCDKQTLASYEPDYTRKICVAKILTPEVPGAPEGKGGAG